MTNPTSNFGWQMPTSTDLVTDLPADFEVFGQAVDTSLADLKGGTTGQVLKKNSNTDMDFVWSADSAGMTNPMTTTGDTIYSSSGSTPARLGIGTTGQVLTVSGGLPTWATAAAGGGLTELASGTLSGNSITLSSISSSYKKLILTMSNFYVDARSNLQLTVNSDSSSIYTQTGVTSTSDGSAQTPSATAAQGWSSSYDWIGNGSNCFTGSTMRNYVEIEFLNYGDTSAYKMWRNTTYLQDNTSTYRQNLSTSIYRSASAISTIKVKVESTNNFSGGTYKLWGLN